MKKQNKCQSLPKNHKVLNKKPKETKVQINKHPNKCLLHPKETIECKPKKDTISKDKVTKFRLDEAIQRRRCKSSFTHIEKDVQFVKKKMQQLTNQKHFNHFLLLYQQQRNQALKVQIVELNGEIAKLKEHFTCFQFLAIKCEKILQASFTANLNHEFYMIEKEQGDYLVHILKETANYMHNTNHDTSSIMHKLKEEAKATILYLNQQHRKSISLLLKKQQALKYLQEECRSIKKVDDCYGEIKTIVNQLIQEVTILWEQLGNKDSIIDSIIVQNDNLQEDLKNMQELIKNTRQSFLNLAQELHVTNEKVRMLEVSIEHKEEQIVKWQESMDSKNKELLCKLQEIEMKQVQIRMVRKQNSQLFQRQKEYQQKIVKYQQIIELLQIKNRELQHKLHYLSNKQQKQMHSEYNKLQEQSNDLKKQIVDNFKKIELYQQKLIQLIALADHSHLFIQDKQGPIAHLLQQLQQDKQESSYKTIFEDNPQHLQRPSQTNISDMFETKQGNYSFQKQTVLIKEQGEPQQQEKLNKIVSRYSIHVIDEQQQTIGSYQI